ncbi:hypothetical protein Tco_1499650 [Tanacetum coccineum]
MSRNRQKVPIDYFFNNDLKYLQRGISTMTYMTSLTKTKAAQYDLLGIEDMVPNIWVPVKVGYDKHALWGRGDCPRLHINDIEDMLLLVVQNWLINLSGDDVSNFTIALKMFTRSLVIQKRVEDLQLGVKSYQKKIIVTKPETTKSDIRKRNPYRTLTGLRTSLDDITKNIRMEYLPKGRWSTLEKKRANIMIKAIDKQLKERSNMDSSMGNMCLGKDVIEIFSDRNEGLGDWDSAEYKYTAGSGGKKEPEALVFHKMDIEEDSDRYIAQCFVNGLYASDGEINLEKNDNLISNDYAVKLCLEYEGEFEPGLIFGRSFSRSANAIVNFEEGTITIQPDFDPFLFGSDEEGKPNLDDLEALLDFDFDEVPQTETDLPPMVCKMGKGSINKKKVMENIMYFNNGAGPSSSIGIPLTQEEAKKRALGHNISMRYEILEEVRPVIETLAYNDKYRKLLDEIWADKVRLDGMIKPKEEKVMAKMKGQMLKEKKDPGAFIFPIRLEGRINENALDDTGSDTNIMPYIIYEQLCRDDIMKEDRNITMINYTKAEVTGRVIGTHPSWWVVDSLIGLEATLTFQTGYLLLLMDILVKPLKQLNQKKNRIFESDSDDEEDSVIKRNDMGTPIHNSRPIGYQNNTNPAENMTLSTLESVINHFRKISVWKKAVSFLGSLPAKLKDVEWKPDYKLCYSNPELATRQWKTEIRTYDHKAGSSRAKRSRNVETVEEALLPDVHYEFLEWRCCSREAKSHEIDQMLKISLKEAQSDEEIFFSVAWLRAFNIREPIYLELWGEFYATYEFDEVCADDELQSKKIISDCKMDEKKGSWKSEGQSDLLWTTLRELTDSENRLIPEILVDDVPRVAAH